MQHLEVSCAVRRFFKSLGFKGLSNPLGGDFKEHQLCLKLSSFHKAVLSRPPYNYKSRADGNSVPTYNNT